MAASGEAFVGQQPPSLPTQQPREDLRTRRICPLDEQPQLPRLVSSQLSLCLRDPATHLPDIGDGQIERQQVILERQPSLRPRHLAGLG